MAKKAQKKSVFGSKALTTLPGRIIFSHLDRPDKFSDTSEEKYSATLILAPSPRLTEILADVEAVGAKAFGKKWVAYGQDNFRRPVMTGEDVLKKIHESFKEKEKEVSQQTIDLYTGHYALSASGSAEKAAPKCYTIVNGKPQEMLRRHGVEEDLNAIAAQFYDGAWVRLCVTTMSYAMGASQGVTFILKGAQFIKDGERLGATDVTAAFGEEVEDFDFGDETGSAFDDGEAEAVDEANI